MYGDGDGALQTNPSSTHRTLRQLLEFETYDEIVQMYVFGFLHNDTDWQQVMQDKNVLNRKIVGTLNSFICHDIIEVDDIFQRIKIHIDAKDEYGNTVLHYAVGKYGSVECVSKLLQYNANENLKDDSGRAPLHLAVRFGDTTDRVSKLNVLLEANADVNAKDNASGWTPLHYVANDVSYIECMDVLINANNVNINQIDNHGCTPLDYAVQFHERWEIREKLLKAGAKRASEL